MNCPECGLLNGSGSNFCRNCGTSLTEDARADNNNDYSERASFFRSGNQSTRSHQEAQIWYANTPIVILLLLTFFPLGVYALYKNRTLARKMKIALFFIFLIWTLIFINPFERHSRRNRRNRSYRTEQKSSQYPKALQRAYLIYERNLIELDDPTKQEMKAFAQLVNSKEKVPEEKLLEQIAKVENSCKRTIDLYKQLKKEVPQALPEDVKVHLEEARKATQQAYQVYGESLIHIKNYLKDGDLTHIQSYNRAIAPANQLFHTISQEIIEAKMKMGSPMRGEL